MEGDPSFVVNVYQTDLDLLHQCIERIRSAYPTAPISIILDGDENPAYGVFSRSHGCYVFVFGTRLKLPRFGGQWVKRMLAIGLMPNTDVIIKVDPDTIVWRPFTAIPDAAYFGSLVTGAPSYIHGGCKGFSAEYAISLIEHEVLDDVRLIDNPALTYAKNSEQLLSEDLVCAEVARWREIPLTHWSEVSPLPYRDLPHFSASHGFRHRVQ